MLRKLTVAALAAVMGLSAGVVELSAPAEAGARKKGAQVKGYVARRGGYSYSQEDTINTYGDSRSKYGGTSFYRDPQLDKQTVSGPFDHGFFFDSAIGARGGDAPYIN